MSGKSLVCAGVRYIRHLETVGFAEAGRRFSEQLETERIRNKRKRPFQISKRERKKQETAVFPREVCFHVFFLKKNCSDEERRTAYRSLEEQTFPCFRTDVSLEEVKPEDYAVFIEENGFLHPSALYEAAKMICSDGAELIYADEDYFEHNPHRYFSPFFKPDYGPDTFRSCNIVGSFLICQKSLLEKVNAVRYAELSEEEQWEALLRMAEKVKKVGHISKVLYLRRLDPGEAIPEPVMRRISIPIMGNPMVSILIPNKDHADDLKRCIDSILKKTTWENYEIIIIENNSSLEGTFEYYSELEKEKKIRIIKYTGGFNYSAINNIGFRESKGDQILLLNNDTEIISPDWIQEMLMYSQRKDVGAVSAKLYYPDGTIQHAGIGIGIKIVAGHYHRGCSGDSSGYFGRLRYAQNVSAVTGACIMIPRHVYEIMGGLDESFSVVYNDIDLCLRIRAAGYFIVWTPWSELIHYESRSRGSDEETRTKRKFFIKETNRFLREWHSVLEAGDPYYNVNLTREKEDFSLR